MKSEKKITNDQAETLISIVKSLTDGDPSINNRERENVFARQIFYKVFRDVNEWSLYRIGALFGRDHATVRHGIKELNNLMSYDEDAAEIYERAVTLFKRSVKIMDSLHDPNTKNHMNKYVYEKLLETTELLKQQNDYIADLKNEMSLMKEEISIIDRRNSEYRPLVELMLDRLPKSKVERAIPKVKQIFNGL